MGLFSRNKPKIKVQTTKKDSFSGWIKCSGCTELVHANELTQHLNCCPKCGYHYRLSLSQRIELMADEGTFKEYFTHIKPLDSLGFVDTESYTDRLANAQKKTGRDDAVATGLCAMGGVNVAIWQLNNGTTNIIETATFREGNWLSFSTPLSSPGSASSPQVGIDSSGNAIAVWQLNNGTNFIIESARFDGNNWSAPVGLTTEGTASAPQVSVNASGEAVVVWQRHNGTNNIIETANYSNGKWSSHSLPLSSIGSASSPQIRVSSSGQAVAVWEFFNGTSHIIESAIYTGDHWTLPTMLTQGFAKDPQVGIDASGLAIATWQFYNGATFVIESAVYHDGNWSPATDLTSPGSASPSQLGVGPSGHAVAIWQLYNGSSNIIEAAIYQPPLPIIAHVTPNFGSATGGDSITITGTNLFFLNSVKFGETNASFTVNSSTSITAIVPPQPVGTTDIRIISQRGTTPLTENNQYTYHNPSPTLTSIMPNFGPSTAGNSITITGTNFIDVVAVRFGQLGALNFTVNSPTSITALVPAESVGAIDVKITTLTGTSPASINSQYIYQTPPPTLTHIHPNFGPSAGGNSVTISGTNFINVNAIKFGSMNASSFIVNSPTSITAIAPSESAGIVDITIATLTGTSENHHYTYQQPIPTISHLHKNFGPITGGNSVTITGTNFTHITSVHFGLKKAISFKVDSPTSITAIAPPGAAGKVDVRIETSIGTSTAKVQYTYKQVIPLAPSNFKGRVTKTNFFVKTDFIDVLTWDPSSDPSVVEYKIYQGNVLLETVTAKGPFTAAIHNRSEVGSDTYTLVALNAASISSLPLTTTVTKEAIPEKKRKKR